MPTLSLKQKNELLIDALSLWGFWARNTDLEDIKRIVSMGADVTYMNNKAIHCASFHGKLDIVKYLHKAGADITAMDNKSIINAFQCGHLDVVKYLHENGADITAVDNTDVEMALKLQRLYLIKYHKTATEKQMIKEIVFKMHLPYGFEIVMYK